MLARHKREANLQRKESNDNHDEAKEGDFQSYDCDYVRMRWSAEDEIYEIDND